jgi:hypothetical protein
MTKTTKTFTATAPNGQEFTFRSNAEVAAVRFLETDKDAEKVDERYIITWHKTVAAAGKSFSSPTWKKFLRPDSVVTDIRVS